MTCRCLSTFTVVFSLGLAVAACANSRRFTEETDPSSGGSGPGGLGGSATEDGDGGSSSGATGPGGMGGEVGETSLGPPVLLEPAAGEFTGTIRAPHLEGPSPLRPEFRWSKVSGANRYELIVDNRCDGDFPVCSFSNKPEISETQISGTSFVAEADLPILIRFPSGTAASGRTYYWAVRACDDTMCGEYSRPRILRVGVLPDDFDGDGYSDLLASAPGKNNTPGAVYYFRGSESGLSSNYTTKFSNPDTPDGSLNTRFGQVLSSVGDTNDDGFPDAVVAHMGSAWIMLGSSAGPVMSDLPFDHPGDGIRVGASGIGDVNGDGYDDVAVSSADSTVEGETEVGRVTIHYGGADGPSLEPDDELHPPDLLQGMWFSKVVTPGDVNGDGYSDVLVGAVLYDDAATDDGVAYLFYGSSTGLVPEPATISNPAGFGSSYFGSILGRHMDWNRDGYADVLVGQPFPHATEAEGGSVYVFDGSRSGVSATHYEWFPEVIPSSETRFGQFVASGGDMDRNGTVEIWISEREIEVAENQFVGRVFAHENPELGDAPPTPRQLLESPELGPYSHLGESLVTRADFNGDAFSDLAVSNRTANDDPINDGGAVYIYYGAEDIFDAPLQTPDVTLVLSKPEDTSDIEFGTTLSEY